MTQNVVPLKGATRAPVSERSSMDTLIITLDLINQWRIPPFQRPVRLNDKVRALAKEIAQEEIIPGVLTLGKIGKDATLYVVDGQHRCEAFRESGCPKGLADVRIVTYETMADMADAFVNLNTALVRMRPDDVLRGMEASVPALGKIRDACPFVGYDMIRRGTYSPILSMAMATRCWQSSSFETPTSNTSGMSTRDVVAALDDESTENLIIFLRTAMEAWGKDKENNRLWSALNLTLCMWTFRRLVLGQGSEMVNPTRAAKVARLSIVQFKKVLMMLSADATYVDWLIGRAMSERDRSPCYRRIRDVIARQLKEDNKKGLVLRPTWAVY